MSVIIKSQSKEIEFRDKPLINIGTNQNCDFVLNLDFDLLLTVQCNEDEHFCRITNNFRNPNVVYNGSVLTKISIDNSCILVIKNSDEFIEIKIKDNQISEEFNVSMGELESLYGDDTSSALKVKIEKTREPLEKSRIAIIKQIAFPITEIRAKIKSNFINSLILHMSLYLSSILSSLAVANYLMGLTAQESVKYVYLATNIQAWMAYSFIIFSIGLMLKQGVFLALTEKTRKKISPTSKIAKNFLLWGGVIFTLGIYTVNLTYYMALSNFFAFGMFISLFFMGAFVTTAITCGYFKSNGNEFEQTLNKLEFREDFEGLLKNYRIWIEHYVNSLTSTKINSIKDKLFLLQLKSFGETIIGILTAPFLAYGVSNTLAICFPEAAGWIRVSGFRFSPVFLTLATFLIIFAFFAFVNSFLAGKKIQASNVIKQDGFNDYRHHGVNIFGLEGVKKLNSEKKMSVSIACSIILIEFMMNISYFMAELGGDFRGVFLSIVAALVPSALLIAETLMLAATKFDIYVRDELLAKLDKE